MNQTKVVMQVEASPSPLVPVSGYCLPGSEKETPLQMEVSLINVNALRKGNSYSAFRASPVCSLLKYPSQDNLPAKEAYLGVLYSAPLKPSNIRCISCVYFVNCLFLPSRI